MKLRFSIILVGAASIGYAQAKSPSEDIKALTACIEKVGLSNAALGEVSDGCVGIVREPWLPETPNTAESITCLSKEDAAWVAIIDKTIAKADPNSVVKLKKRRAVWIAALPKVCEPEEEGSLAYVENEYCEQTEIAKLAVDILKRTRE